MRHSIRGSLPAGILISLSFVAGAATAGGMMDGGMMGGMMGQGANGSPSANEDSSNPAARNLAGFINSNNLACLSCHSVNSRGMGPAFLDIASRYAGNDDAQSTLAISIVNGAAGKWTGYPVMPRGLASPSQATKLATLILSLAAHPNQ